LATWKGSVIQCGSVATLVGVETALRRKNGGDDACWTYVNLTGLKNKKKLTQLI
jgi:hypothetical protein